MPLTTLKASNFVDDSVTVGKLSTTGTASSSTYLRGDNSLARRCRVCLDYIVLLLTTDYTVTVAGSKFVIDGVSQATLTLTEGYTAVCLMFRMLQIRGYSCIKICYSSRCCR